MGQMLSPYFSKAEIACRHCGRIGPYPLQLKQLLFRLERLRELVGKPVHLTCAYRCPEHNAAVGGVPGSYHTLDMAADLWVEGLTVDQVADAAEQAGFGGVGRYYGTQFVHVDCGPENRFKTWR